MCEDTNFKVTLLSISYSLMKVSTLSYRAVVFDNIVGANISFEKVLRAGLPNALSKRVVRDRAIKFRALFACLPFLIPLFV